MSMLDLPDLPDLRDLYAALVLERWRERAAALGQGMPGGKSLALAMLGLFAAEGCDPTRDRRRDGLVLEHAIALDKHRRRRGIPGVWGYPARVME